MHHIDLRTLRTGLRLDMDHVRTLFCNVHFMPENGCEIKFSDETPPDVTSVEVAILILLVK